MADYIYLLENRLSAAQQAAINIIRDVARSRGLTVFLVGGAVRDLTSGSPVRDLDVVVQGNALKLKQEIELAGGVVTGESVPGQSLFVRFSGGVRVEIGSTLSVTYPKPGKPVVVAATILDDLRRRDFTANAMALSLNEGSYGLLMDPLNGVADIENRQLRLVSNYGFIEDPVRMIRAARFVARLGWTMDEKTQGRYETGKQEDYIAVLDDFHRGYESEEIFHEEDPLRILRKLEEEGWMKFLFPALTVAKANAAELEKLRDVQTQLQVRGIHPEAAAANFPLVTAKLSAKEIADLKNSFVRPGFVQEIESLEQEAKDFSTQLLSRSASLPSQTWKLLEAAKPEAVLWIAYSTKSAAVQAKLKSFYTEWPQARTKIPYSLMQEMRIVPELPIYAELVEKLFYELMDGKLGTVEEMKAYLETYSPPAPPPTVHLRRARTAKKDAKSAKGRKKAAVQLDDEDEDDLDAGPKNPAGEDDDDGIDADDVDGNDEDQDGPEPLDAPPAKARVEEDDEEEDEPAPKKSPKSPAPIRATPGTIVAVPAKAVAAKKAEAAVKAVSAPAKKSAPAKTIEKPTVVAKAPAKKTVAAKDETPEKKTAAKKSDSK